MKYTKILALVLSAGLMLGTVSGCRKRIKPQATSVIKTEMTTSKESSEAMSSEENESSFSGDQKVKIDSELQEKANTFVTNFVMQFFQDYDRETATIEQLLDFVHIYLKINSYKSLKNETKGELSFETFSFAEAREIVVKYFGTGLDEVKCKTLPAPPSSYGDQPAGPFYADGRIWYEGGAGESYSSIAIVDSIKNNEDGTLTLNFTKYTIDQQVYEELDDNGIKKYYKLTPDKAKADKTLEKGSNGTAVVGVSQSGDYFLMSYKTLK